MQKDPYKYFRIEARELADGLAQGLVSLQRGKPAHVAVPEVLRLAHTLKGAARVVRLPELANLAHAIEDLLEPHRASAEAAPKAAVVESLRLIDEIAMKVHELERGPLAPAPVPIPVAAPVPAPVPAEIAEPRANERVETVQVDLVEIESLFRGIAESGAQISALRRELALLEPMRRQLAALRTSGVASELESQFAEVHGRLSSRVDRAGTDLGQVLEAAERMRLLRASTLFASLQRIARDTARKLDKPVELTTEGGDVRLDAHVLAALRGGLMHVVTNAIAHGIETAAERTAAGKPAQGRVSLRVERRGGRVAFLCSDDGRGIDVAAVQRAAQRNQLDSGNKPLDMAGAAALLLRGGLTTTDAVTTVSGRGIGLDALRAMAERLHGEVRLHSEPGRGTTFEVEVPISLSSFTALFLESNGVASAVPLSSVVQTLRLQRDAIAHAPGRDAIVHDGQMVPFLHLGVALRQPFQASQADKPFSAVILRSSAGLAAIGVDRLLGASHVTVQPLPALAAADAVVSGATLDAEGTPQFLLDPDALVLRARQGGQGAERGQEEVRPAILVIDDSLTTRMLEQSILESAGYDVDLAASAEEGLAKARQRPYRLFLCDVEMPGMNGFEFVALTRADADLRDTPAILVTSLASPEDRKRGLDAGARAYIVKGEFDQGNLLRTIRGLVG